MTELYSQVSRNQAPSPALGGFVRSGRAPASPPLPCLYSNNSIETPSDQGALGTVSALCNLLTPYHRRQAHTLFANVERLITRVAPSLNHVGFITLTFPNNITDHREAYKRFRSMNSNFLSSWEVTDWVCVKERQTRGAWHYHLIAVFKEDIRTGIDFSQLENGNYTSASPYLRRIWRELREAMKSYGFGRSEVLPVKSNAEAMARYVGKYISKHIDTRSEEDKGVRLVNYSRGWERNSVQFAWYTENSKEWRRKLALFAQYCGCSDIYQLSDKLGPGWAYRYADLIVGIDQTLSENGGELAEAFVDPTLRRLTGPDPLKVAFQEKVALNKNGVRENPDWDEVERLKKKTGLDYRDVAFRF